MYFVHVTSILVLIQIYINVKYINDIEYRFKMCIVAYNNRVKWVVWKLAKKLYIIDCNKDLLLAYT